MTVFRQRNSEVEGLLVIAARVEADGLDPVPECEVRR